MPFIGFSNFYMGNTFAGCCELANSIMALICAAGIVSFRKSMLNKATNAAINVGAGILVLNLAKAIHMFNSVSFENTEIVVIIISVIIACMHLAENNDAQRHHSIIATTLIVILTGVLETMRDIYTVSHYGRDGFGCPFV